MQPPDLSLISTDPVHFPLYAEKGIRVSIGRLDKIHPVISGNKFFKLRFYLEEARQSGKKRIVTFGGAWSNHIAATAAACKVYGFAAAGFIRGEKPDKLSPTLLGAIENGMELFFLERGDFSIKKRTVDVADDNDLIIPEGGYGSTGALGAATMADCFQFARYSHICCAAGTGTMAAGLLSRTSLNQQLVCVSVLKNNHQLEADIQSMVNSAAGSLVISHDYHFGGYARHNPELTGFMNDFFRQTSIPSDFVYTGKLFYAIHDMISKNKFAPGSHLLIIHSGGLQGNASLSNGTLIF